MFEYEEWRVIVEFPNYSVSNYGRIKHRSSNDVRKVSTNMHGFPVIVLYGSDKKTRYLRQVNNLVADAFLDPPPEYPYSVSAAIWHIDGNLENCHLDNLRWDSRPRVLEWNEMHREGGPSKFKHPTKTKVKNNQTGIVYENTYDCAIAEGELESSIIWRIEKQARNVEDDSAKYRYLFE